MRARRRWAPVVTRPTTAPTEAGTGFEGRNERYTSDRGQLDRNRRSSRSLDNPAIDDYRRWLGRDATIRDALLNPDDYEPREV